MDNLFLVTGVPIFLAAGGKEDGNDKNYHNRGDDNIG
jgi:hypothetical protein